MHRREFFTGGLGFAALAIAGTHVGKGKPLTTAPVEKGELMSVNGWVPNPGVVLPHEHILVDFSGAGKVDPANYDADEVFKVALPKLKELRSLGCDTLVECTPAYLARDVKLLARLSAASGLNILTNTGYYGARDHLFLPDHVNTESPKQLAGRWISEWENGIEGTAIRPGFIKIGVDKAPLSALQKKIVKAAALTYLKTGLVIGIHTGNGQAAVEELSLLEREGVLPGAFIWIHAQSEPNSDYHVQLARKGAWIEFDGIRKESLDRHLDLLKMMKANKLLDRALISQDAGWYHVGEPGGGDYRGYGLLFTEFLPLLKENGFSAGELKTLTRTNPRHAFAVRASG